MSFGWREERVFHCSVTGAGVRALQGRWTITTTQTASPQSEVARSFALSHASICGSGREKVIHAIFYQ